MSEALLRVERLQAAYGASQVLFDVNLAVAPGEMVALLGRNGMGKTTSIRAIMGLLRPSAGRVVLAGRQVAGWAPEEVARLGIGLVPEGRQIFPTLNVRENLVATAANRASRSPAWTLPRIFALFPRLRERAAQSAATLSGGEQQMLAVGRALMTNPALLILDEATEGLAPLMRDEIWRCIATLKAEGLAVLIVDKNFSALQRLADRHVILEKGRTVWTGSPAMLAAEPDAVQRWLGV
jgi:branched-chain amino acid transport system ATP-binding protein